MEWIRQRYLLLMYLVPQTACAGMEKTRRWWDVLEKSHDWDSFTDSPLTNDTSRSFARQQSYFLYITAYNLHLAQFQVDSIIQLMDNPLQNTDVNPLHNETNLELKKSWITRKKINSSNNNMLHPSSSVLFLNYV